MDYKADQKQAETALRTIADNARTTVREIYQLVNKAYIDEENIQKRALNMRDIDRQHKQMNLIEIQTRNEYLQNVILERKLLRMNKRSEFFKNLKNKFKWIRKNSTK